LKLLSYQSFSLYANGGGNRILRRLYQGREQDVISLVVEHTKSAPGNGAINETIVYAAPTVQKWARWRVRTFITWLRHKVFKGHTVKRVQEAAATLNYDVLHVVDHGAFSDALCANGNSVHPLWVSFHDHYTTTFGSYDASFTLWTRASRRLVISKELGVEYQRLFGNKPFEIITDGVLDTELSQAQSVDTETHIIYFAGLLHIDYIPLFGVLANALDALSKQGYQFKLVLRGTQNIPSLIGRSFTTDYRPMTLNNAELKQELDESTILYLPIKFTKPDFYLYSLSTKMVGYLGAPGAILYHGPADSAAANLLQQHKAAVCCGDMDETKLSEDILTLIKNRVSISANATTVAQQQFNMDDIQKRFWQSR
jgi:hypothetical protein